MGRAEKIWLASCVHLCDARVSTYSLYDGGKLAINMNIFDVERCEYESNGKQAKYG